MMSQVDQYTIDCEYLFIKEILCTFLVQCYNILEIYIFAHEIMKKTPSKVAHNWPFFFSVLPTSPKSTQISYSVPKMAPCAISI